MSEVFSFECPNCGMTLEVPTEYCGQAAECSECSEAFTLPTLQEVQAMYGQQEEAAPVEQAAPAPIEQAAPAPVEEEPEEELDMAETGTVKIDRASIGMIPDVKDQFKLDLGTMDSNPKVEMDETPDKNEGVDEAALNIPPKPKKKWWQFWK